MKQQPKPGSVQVLPGDVMLVDWKHPNKYLNKFLDWQDYFDDGKYNHAMIYYGESEHGKHTVMEITFEGLILRNIDIKNFKGVLLSPKKPFIKQEIRACIYDTYMESPKDYDFKGLFAVGISTIMWKLTTEKNGRLLILPLN